MASTWKTIAVVLAAGACLAALVEPPRKTQLRDAAKGDAPLLPRKELLQVIGAGYRPMVADYFWIQAIHQLGLARTQYEYRDAYYYVDIVTDLDPRFRYAYVFGSTGITFNLGRETWVNTEESTRLLEKGLKVFPDDVYLRIIYAYNLSFYHRRPLEAAKVLEETAKLPYAPSYLPALATRLYAQAGAFDTGLSLAEQLAVASSDPEQREFFQRRVKEIELERILRTVDEAIAAYAEREGRSPRDLRVLVDANLLREVPVDPLGGAIYVGEDGRAYSTSATNRLESHAGYANDPEELED